MRSKADDFQDFALRVLIVLAIVTAGVVLWAVSDVLVLAFGGVLMACALRALSDPLAIRLHLSPRLALAIVMVALLVLLGGAGVLIGERLADQAGQLAKALPEDVSKARSWAEQSTLGRLGLEAVRKFGTGNRSFAGIGGLASGTLGALVDILVIFFLGIYLAADPDLYRRGALRLVPRSGRQRADLALVAAGGALRNWLRGQLVSMVVIGTVTGIGLSLMDIPLALSMGVFAGLMEFIPFVGPLLAAVPAVLLGFAKSPSDALWVAVFYLALHQIEGNVLMPLVQRWAVSLPPALAVSAVVAFGLLFGAAGVLFAVPLMIVAIVFIERFYVEPIVGEAPPGISSSPGEG